MCDSSSLPSEAEEVKTQCTCASLNATDIPGAILPRSPEKCKVKELRVWLKSRSQTVKNRETKAELVLRVKSCLEQRENLTVVDPYPGQPYLTKVKANCQSCSEAEREKVQTDSLAQEKTETFTDSTGSIPHSFSYLDILDYAKKSGKNTNFVEKPIERGYAFFHDGYVFEQAVAVNSDVVTIKAKCFRSMKKSEAPHSLSVNLNHKGGVLVGKCSCVAGVGGQCNHVYALLYSIDHVLKLKLKRFARPKTCTEKPAEWRKCRTEGVRSEPVMTGTVLKPKYGSTSKGIKSTLYEARAGNARRSLKVNETLKEKLAAINPLFGICTTVSDSADSCKTRMNFDVPNGSPLSYQLSLTEGDFKVTENIGDIGGEKADNSEMPPQFPWRDTATEPIPAESLKCLDLNVTCEEANDIFKKTLDQSSSDLWFSVRKFRLTASKFGQIMKRKKDKEKFIRTQLVPKNDISNVPAVKYGQDNEEKAVRQYLQYMNQSKREVKSFKSGCVINPKFPWMAASPDRIVFDQKAGFGLIEVKCSHSKRNVTPEEACMDSSFFCQLRNNKIFLKKDHDYYAQVQGQLGVCGANYCDFVVFTNKGLGIQRIPFDNEFWNNMSAKLRTFFLIDFLPVVRKM